MKSLKDKMLFRETATWEEQSGLLAFLSAIPSEVEKFNERFEFDIQQVADFPVKIDDSSAPAMNTGFVLIRRNRLMPEITYCLYSVLNNGVLDAYIGLYKGDNITPLKQLRPLRNFKKGRAVLYDWLSQLVRASCEKIMR